MTSKPVIGEYDKHSDKQPDFETSAHRDEQARQTANTAVIGQPDILSGDAGSQASAKREGRRQGTKDTPGILAIRLAQAERMARTPTTTVTLRVPQEFNAWLDEYVHRSWPDRVRKQELVTEALRLLFARRGRHGEPVISTELLKADWISDGRVCPGHSSRTARRFQT
jgi:hypothetical protein